MMKFWEKLESKSSYHYPNSWWVRGRLVPNTCHLKKLGRAYEDQIKARTSELFDSETLEQFIEDNWNISIISFMIRLCILLLTLLSTLRLQPHAKCVEFSAQMLSSCYSVHHFLMSEENGCLCPMWVQCWILFVIFIEKQ